MTSNFDPEAKAENVPGVEKVEEEEDDDLIFIDEPEVKKSFLKKSFELLIPIGLLFYIFCLTQVLEPNPNIIFKFLKLFGFYVLFFKIILSY